MSMENVKQRKIWTNNIYEHWIINVTSEKYTYTPLVFSFSFVQYGWRWTKNKPTQNVEK